MGGFKKNTKANRVYQKFTLSWQQDIYESNRSSWTREDDIDLLYINRLLDLKSRTKKTIPHITLKQGRQMITKEMVEYYLDDDYDRWIANFLTDVCNDPNDIYIIKKEIQDAWDQRSEVN